MKIKILILILITATGCGRQTEREAGRIPGFPVRYPVLHPNYREWASPSRDIEARFNPPALLWPVTRGKKVTYDVRLSSDSSFTSTDIFHAEGLNRTIFNPHQTLKPGTWYWQFRLHGGQWSEVNSFRISRDAIGFAAPPADSLWSAIPDAHPRVLLGSADIGVFRKACLNLPDAQVIIREADSMLAEPPMNETQGRQKVAGLNSRQDNKLAMNASMKISNFNYTAIDHFCKAYLLTGDPKYVAPAIRYGMEVASWDPDGLSELSDFGDARCMLGMALVFDTFYGQLNAGQKTKLLKNIETRAQRFYESWANNIDAKVLSNHVWQYILDYFFSTAVALYGESDHARDWLDYAYELWLARAPVLGGKDGAWVNGFSYFRLNMETLLDIPMIIKNYTGFDFIGRHPWYRQNAYWAVYGFPPGSSSDGFGDNCEELFAPGQEYLAWADALSKLVGSEAASWYKTGIAETTRLSLPEADMLRWFRLRYLRNLKPAPVGDPGSWSQSKAFYDAGVVEMHTNLANTGRDLMVAMRSSPYGAYGHMLADQNTFQILYGGKRLFYNSGFKIDMKDPHRLLWYKHTRGHNGILIDDLGQPFDTEAYGWIARFVNGSSLSYSVGDASMAYSSSGENQDAGLKKFRRHILLLRPGIIAIYDDLEAGRKAGWQWLVHSPEKISIDSVNNKFECANSAVSSSCFFFSSEPVHWSLTDTFAVPAKNWKMRTDEEGNVIHYENSQYHLVARSAMKTEKIRFLTLILLFPKDSGTEYKVSIQSDSSLITIGNWTIKAVMDTSKSALLEAVRKDGSVSFTSSGDRLVCGDKTYRGTIPGSTKLAEKTNGKMTYTEQGEQIPDVVMEIPPGKKPGY